MAILGLADGCDTFELLEPRGIGSWFILEFSPGLKPNEDLVTLRRKNKGHLEA